MKKIKPGTIGHPHTDRTGTIVNVDLTKGRVRPGIIHSPQRPVPPPGRSPGKKKESEKQRFIWAEGQQESGGNYGVVNSSSGALGRWQVMPANLPSWLARSGLPDMSPQSYLDNHAAQNRLAWVILGGDYDSYGPRGAASVWYSGQPDWHETYGDPPVYQYVDDVIAIMNSSAPGTVPPSSGGSGVTAGPIPSPGSDTWSTEIRGAYVHMHTAATRIQHHARMINQMLR